jgi:5-formyltetrahydrofolate cyclo-ligase
MEPPDPIEASKTAVRHAMAQRRAEIDPRWASQVGLAMADILSANPEWMRGRRIGLFAGLADEPDTRPILTLLQRAGKEVFFPRSRADGGLAMARLEDGSDLVPGRFGTLEPPQDAPCSSLLELDLVFIPGVAFDRYGGRLGRGGGFYDRALAGAKVLSGPRRLGVGFAFQMVARVPVLDHDQAVHGILTEEGLARSMDPG